MESKHPCEACKAKDRASGCSRCVLDEHETECCNYDCMINYEGMCKMGFGKVCKASTEYEDDIAYHDCSECTHYRDNHEDSDGIEVDWCEKKQEEVGRWDSACEDFKEGNSK